MRTLFVFEACRSVADKKTELLDLVKKNEMFFRARCHFQTERDVQISELMQKQGSWK